MDFETFKRHIQKLKDKIKRVDIKLSNIATNETLVLTKHFVKSILKNGEKIKYKVFAEFKIAKGKVVQFDELTLLIVR